MAVSISSANLVGDTMTVVGTGFGSKSTPAPLTTVFMDTTDQGDNYLAAGFDVISSNWDDSPDNYVDMAEGIGGGGGSWYTHIDHAGAFQHFGNYFASGHDEIYFSYWCKFEKIGTGGTVISGGQIKGPRLGFSTSTDPVTAYSAGRTFSFSAFVDDVAANPCVGGQPQFRYHDDANTEIIVPAGQSGVEPFIYDGDWHFLEGRCVYNSVGVADGIAWLYCDGVECYTNVTLEVSDFANDFRFLQWLPGITNDFESMVTDCWFAHMYADGTQSRAVLGNASTLAACTQFFTGVPSSWSSTDIIADFTNIPTGFDWLYVADSTNTINSSGFAYGAAAPTFNASWVRSSNQLI